MKLSTVLIAVVLGTIATIVTAQGNKTESWSGVPGQLNTNGEQTGASMKCFVDTQAYDKYRSGHCYSVGNSRTATAVFKIDGGPDSNFRVHWSDKRCSKTSKNCFLPISWFHSITVSADVLDLSNGTFISTSATAEYEGYF